MSQKAQGWVEQGGFPVAREAGAGREGEGSKAQQQLALFQRTGFCGCWLRKLSGGPV